MVFPAAGQVGVLVNDLAAINIDAKLLAAATPNGSDADPPRGAQARPPPSASFGDSPPLDSKAPPSPPEILELTNGCICCNLKGDMLLVRVNG